MIYMNLTLRRKNELGIRDKEKYYWLKLDRNFFKRHDIRIIEDMPDGKEYVLFYLNSHPDGRRRASGHGSGGR